MVDPAPFYVVEFVGFDEREGTLGSAHTGEQPVLKWRLLLKGYKARSKSKMENSSKNPYDSYHLPGWRLRTDKGANGDPVVRYSKKNPDEKRYEALTVEVPETAMLAMYAFQLTKAENIPFREKEKIQELLQRRGNEKRVE